MQMLLPNFLTKPDFIAFDCRYSRYFSFKLASRMFRVYSLGWTVKTRDGSLSAHYEHTVAITENGPELLTKID